MFGRGGTRAGKRGGTASRKLLATACALLFVSLAVNLLQWSAARDERARHLSVNLARKSKQDGTEVHDISLKEMPLEKQLVHPHAISTEALQKLIDSGDPPLLIDVREDEEFAMGRIPGTIHVRYPDIQADASLIRNSKKPVILLCYSGNRSGELVEEFLEHGLQCRFLVGGYEKWFNEKRPMDESHLTDDIRQVPEYPNRDTLLDTERVTAEWKKGGVTFLDVRYDAEFNAGHLPGAVQITARRLVSTDLMARVRALPHDRRYITACYDRRSSFYSKIIGSKLAANGYSYLGRYTVPYEFVEPAPEPPSIPWTASFSPAFVKLAKFGGGFGGAILLIVFAIRLLLLPLSRASARNTRRLEASGRKDAVSILPGLAFTALQLVAFIALGTFLATTRDLVGAPFVHGWIDDLSKPDPLSVLPVVAGFGFLSQLWLTGRMKRRVGAVISIAVCVAVVAVARPLSAAVGLYLSVNLLLAALEIAFFGRTSHPRALIEPVPIVALRDAWKFSGIGGKAMNESILARAGFAVPPGFVLTTKFFERGFDEAAQRAILEHFDRLRADRVAVRSSAIGEDGAEQSFAGLFDTVLGVERNGIVDAVRQVAASLTSDSGRAAAYKGRSAGCCVLVQAMVPAEFAGVAFSRDPKDGSRLSIELVNGLGVGLVDGSRNPVHSSFGRVSRRRIANGPAPPIDLGPLVDRVIALEDVFGAPQDIEWAFAAGKFWILQARPITATIRGSEEEGFIAFEKARLSDRARAAGRAFRGLRRGDLGAQLPFPTPASLSLLRRLRGANGAAAIAAERMSIPFDSAVPVEETVVTAFGWLFEDLAMQARQYPTRGALDLVRIATAERRILRERGRAADRLTNELVPALRARVRRLAAIDRTRLPATDLAALLDEQVATFVGEAYAEAEIVNLVAAHAYGRVSAVLRDKSVPISSFIAAAPAPMDGLGIDDAIAEYGHRAVVEWELAEPRHRENPGVLLAALEARRRAGREPARRHDVRDVATLGLTPRKERRFRADLQALETYEPLKEFTKHEFLREVAEIRKTLLEMGTRLGIGDDVFLLTLEESIAACSSECAIWPPAIEARRAERRCFERLTLDEALDIEAIEALEARRKPTTAPGDGSKLAGTWVAGSSEVVGPVRRIETNEDRANVRRGDILVSPTADASLALFYPLAAGVVTEMGGALCHAAIVAREYDLPAVFGVPGMLSAVKNGDLVRLETDGVVTLVGAERRRMPRTACDAPVEIRAGDRAFVARARNASRSGLLVEADASIPDGILIEVSASTAVDGALAPGAVRRARVVRRNGAEGALAALEFCEG
ncbi:MAG: hypothetical protein HYR85_00325 [Planctomycetes bacterium]|nr:hypothetical protein [Planctomycetota bacterium]